MPVSVKDEIRIFMVIQAVDWFSKKNWLNAQNDSSATRWLQKTGLGPTYRWTNYLEWPPSVKSYAVKEK